MISYCVVIISTVIFFICIALPLTGVGILSYRIDSSECTIESIGHRNCYEQKAQIILEQYIGIDGNRSAFIYCGPVLHCEISPCNIKVAVGLQYWCYQYNNDNLYKLTDFGETNGRRVGGIILCLIVVVLIMIGGCVFFCKVLPTTPIFDKHKTYSSIDDDSEISLDE
jgi:hypothetical protein